MPIATLLALLALAFGIPVSFGLVLLGEYALIKLRQR